MKEFDNEFDESDAIVNTAVGLQAANVAWMMFAQTGMPGMYMLYADLLPPHTRERHPLD